MLSDTLWHLSFLLYIIDKHCHLGFFPFLRIMHNTRNRDLELVTCVQNAELYNVWLGVLTRVKRKWKGKKREGMVSHNSVLKKCDPPKTYSWDVSFAFETDISTRKWCNSEFFYVSSHKACYKLDPQQLLPSPLHVSEVTQNNICHIKIAQAHHCCAHLRKSCSSPEMLHRPPQSTPNALHSTRAI